MEAEILVAVFAFFLVAAVLLGGPILALVAFLRTGRIKRLEHEVARLARELVELRAGRASAAAPSEDATAGAVSATPFAAAPADVELVAAELADVELAGAPAAPGPAAPGAVPFAAAVPATPAARGTAPGAVPVREIDGRSLELFIGRQALGWIAVVVLLFGTVFFLRYAYENQWIGPLGRVSIAVAAGAGLVGAGWRYDRRGWRTFSRMLTAAGVLVLYLATYSAFGFYELIPPRAAGVLLAIVVVEGVLLALVYDSWSIALMSIVGGLLIPIQLRSDRDQYVSLFLYLLVLNLGVLGMLLRRPWRALGTVALVGTQLIFLGWYVENFHPDKLAWGVGFQLALFAAYWLHGLSSAGDGRQATLVEGLARSTVGAVSTFGLLYLMLVDRHRDWLGVAAVAMAGAQALEARLVQSVDRASPLRVFAAAALSFGFIALAFPLQAEAPWVAVGWGAQAAVLSWFGLRIESYALRGLSFVLAVLSGLRLILVNAPWHGRESFVPLWNDFATPALLVVTLLIGSLVLSRRRLAVAPEISRVAAGLLVVGCVLLVWIVLSLEIEQYCAELGRRAADFAFERTTSIDWRRAAQMSVSVGWALYASLVLALGFRLRLAFLRWTALGLFAITVLKVFVVDMAGLDEIYRIVAFLLLAVLLGGAAWAYQRLTPRDAA